jgi:hypothetical protein
VVSGIIILCGSSGGDIIAPQRRVLFNRTYLSNFHSKLIE